MPAAANAGGLPAAYLEPLVVHLPGACSCDLRPSCPAHHLDFRVYDCGGRAMYQSGRNGET